MFRTRTNGYLILAAILMLAVACSNPAADKPEAQVREASEAGDRGSGAGTSTRSTGGAAPKDGAVVMNFTSNSKIEFTGSKVTGKHDGGFREFGGAVTLVDSDPAKSHVGIQIAMDSIWADNERLTGHLKSPDFFDVANLPTATFDSTEIVPTDDGYEVSGDLTLHGVTKNITFPAQITVSGDTVRTQAEFFIRRFDFEIRYPGKPDDLIRDEVVIRLDMEAKAG